MLYGWLLDKNGHRCEPLADLSYPVVLLQGSESRSDRFIESLRGDLYGVLNVSNILYRNCARSKNHVQKRSIFAFSSLRCSALTCKHQDSQHMVDRLNPQRDSTRAMSPARLAAQVAAVKPFISGRTVCGGRPNQECLGIPFACCSDSERYPVLIRVYQPQVR